MWMHTCPVAQVQALRTVSSHLSSLPEQAAAIIALVAELCLARISPGKRSSLRPQGSRGPHLLQGPLETIPCCRHCRGIRQTAASSVWAGYTSMFIISFAYIQIDKYINQAAVAAGHFFDFLAGIFWKSTTFTSLPTWRGNQEHRPCRSKNSQEAFLLDGDLVFIGTRTSCTKEIFGYGGAQRT